MNKLTINPNNRKYYSEDFIKGFECGVEKQYAEDMKENTAKWKTNNFYEHYCSNCGMYALDDDDHFEKLSDYCPFCGAKMEEE